MSIVEHQIPDPIVDRAAASLHPGERRHIQQDPCDGVLCQSRVWWWEPDGETCTPLPGDYRPAHLDPA